MQLIHKIHKESLNRYGMAGAKLELALFTTKDLLLVKNEKHEYILFKLDKDNYLAVFSETHFTPLNFKEVTEELKYCKVLVLDSFFLQTDAVYEYRVARAILDAYKLIL